MAFRPEQPCWAHQTLTSALPLLATLAVAEGASW